VAGPGLTLVRRGRRTTGANRSTGNRVAAASSSASQSAQPRLCAPFPLVSELGGVRTGSHHLNLTAEIGLYRMAEHAE
jgi:hypothetical protein